MAVGRHDRPTRRRDASRRRITVTLRSEDFLRLKNAVAARDRLSMQSVCEEAILAALERLEAEHGGRFPAAPAQRGGSRFASNHRVDLYA
jgi:hypothetical protein